MVENRTGGRVLMAADAAAKSPPDVYTPLLSSFHSVLAILKNLEKLPYDPQKDLMPIIHFANGPKYSASGPDIGSLKDLIAYAKANPGKLTSAAQSSGSSGHTQVMLRLRRHCACPLSRRRARRSGLAGHVSMMFDVAVLALPQLTSGRWVRSALPRRGAARRVDASRDRSSRHQGRCGFSDLSSRGNSFEDRRMTQLRQKQYLF